MKRSLTRVAVAGLAAAAMTASAAPASAQLPDLPEAPSGAIGELLSPLEDLIGMITDPLGDALGDVPLDNAVALQAEDAVDAAIALSLITFETSDFAFLGRDDVFADTLSSVAGQGLAGAPLLLTQTDAIDQRTQDELDRLGVSRIIILGQEVAISEAVEAELVGTYGEGNVTRVGGPTRIETAAELAAELAPSAERVVMMRAYPGEGGDQSQAYVDALAAGPFASSIELPSLLTTTDYLHPATEAYLESAGVAEVTLIGGETAIGPEVETALTDMGLTVNRIAGANRYDTAVLVAKAMGFLDAADANRIILSEAGSVEDPLWAAGFAAAAHGAVFGAPVILADGPLLPPETLAFIADGLISNALRLSNEPLICNSFVDLLACETAALLMLGVLDEVNALTGGLLETILGPAFEPLQEQLEETLPPPGESSPGLIGQIVGLIGFPGDDGDDDEDTLALAMATQPPAVVDAFERMIGPAGQRVSTSQQAVLIGLLADLRQALGAPVQTIDPAQADALVAVLDGITATLGSERGAAPLTEMTAMLDGIAVLAGDLDVAALQRVISTLSTDAAPQVGDLAKAVTGALAGDVPAEALVDTYGSEAQPLADALTALAQL
jgi:putative cell wall-binding protein